MAPVILSQSLASKNRSSGVFAILSMAVRSISSPFFIIAQEKADGKKFFLCGWEEACIIKEKPSPGRGCQELRERNTYHHGDRYYRGRGIRHGGGHTRGAEGGNRSAASGAAGTGGAEAPGYGKRPVQPVQSPRSGGRLPRRRTGFSGLCLECVPAGENTRLVSLFGAADRGGALRAGVSLLRPGQFCGRCTAICPGQAQYPPGRRGGGHPGEAIRGKIPAGNRGGDLCL